MKNMPKKILKGKVVKNNRSKTITVLVERKYQHPVLKKVIKTKKKYHAHDEKNLLKVGDKVSIIETNPISKQKKFKVLEVIQ
jgi:small subunit ribosomal protein S17|tara:strand:+ start:36 stop:281 length:246 start_codon:yes stop_codon:yes gene_type:complete